MFLRLWKKFKMDNNLKIFSVLMLIFIVADLLYFIYSPSYLIAWAIGWICGLFFEGLIIYSIIKKEVKRK